MKIVIPLAPIGKGRPRLGRYGVHTPLKTVQWTKAAQGYLRDQFKRSPLSGPLRVSMLCVFPLPKGKYRVRKPVKRSWHTFKPDLDNVEKICFDAGNGILWKDDAIICCVETTKIIGAQGEEPRVEITIEELECYDGR